LILIVVINCLLSFASYAKENDITLWIMPNEPPLAQKPSDEQIEKFIADNLNVRNTAEE